MVLNSKTLVQRVAKQAVATLVKELGDGSGGGETTLGDVEVGLADAPHADLQSHRANSRTTVGCVPTISCGSAMH